MTEYGRGSFDIIAAANEVSLKEGETPPRYTAGSTKRSVLVGATDLLPPPAAIVNTTPVTTLAIGPSDEPAPEDTDEAAR